MSRSAQLQAAFSLIKGANAIAGPVPYGSIPIHVEQQPDPEKERADKDQKQRSLSQAARDIEKAPGPHSGAGGLGTPA